MVAQMLERGKVLMRVEGPYGKPYGLGWHKYDALAIFAGGIGTSSICFDTGYHNCLEHCFAPSG